MTIEILDETKTYIYYVAYSYGVGGHGCYEAKLREPLDTYERVLALAASIAAERQHTSLVITGWKRFQ